MLTTRRTSSSRSHCGLVIEALEGRRMMASGYVISAPSNVFTTLAQNWSNRLVTPGTTSSPAYNGSDGLYSIPLNGIDKMGSAWNTSTWHMYTFGDTFVGSYNSSTGLRNANSFVNNTAAVHQTTGSSPTAMTFKWRGTQGVTPAEQMAVISRPTADTTQYYWPSDGVVVNGQVVQLALRQKAGTLETQGVTILTAPVDGTFNTTTDWPYNGVENTTWFNTDNRFGIGSVRNVFLADTSTSDPFNGPRAAGAAILDTSSTTRAFQSDGYLYTYAVQNGVNAFEKYAFVARGTPSNYSNSATWQYWSQLAGEPAGTWRGNGSGVDAIGWGTAMKDVNGNFITDMASEFSVVQMPDGRLAMLYNKFDAFGGGALAVRYAPAGQPQGPWTLPTTVYTISTPNTGNSAIGLRAMPTTPRNYGQEGWIYVTYGAKIHPQISRAPTQSVAGRLLVSFHVSTLDTTPAGQFGPEFTYGDIYRPRFLELKIEWSNNAPRLSTTTKPTEPSEQAPAELFARRPVEPITLADELLSDPCGRVEETELD